MKLSLLNSSETVQMSMSGGEAVSLSLKTGAVQTGGSLSIGHGLKWESGALLRDADAEAELDQAVDRK